MIISPKQIFILLFWRKTNLYFAKSNLFYIFAAVLRLTSVMPRW